MIINKIEEASRTKPLFEFDTLKDGKLCVTKGNVKLGNGIYTFSTLPGDMMHKLYIKGKSVLACNITGTCSGHCNACFDNGCYAVKSVQQYYKSVVPAWGGNTILLRSGKLFDELDKYIKSKNRWAARAPEMAEIKTFRINVAGELRNSDDVEGWNELAKKHPETVFSVYTKNYEAVEGFMARHPKGTEPNFVINISQWHGCADKFLKRFPGKFNVFEYDDSNREDNRLSYDELVRLRGVTHCPAVDSNGKHAKTTSGEPITCSSCMRCYRKGFTHTAVYSH